MNKRLISITGDYTTSQPPARLIGSGRGKLNGMNFVREGDHFHCPACNTTGKIICIAPRHHMMDRGIPVALHGDIACCACNPKPRINTVMQHSAGQVVG